MQTADTIVIGAGQAGLAMSRCLADRAIDHVVLERARPAERWRSECWGARGEDDALAEYQATRDHLSARLFTTTDVIAGHRWSEDDIAGLLRELSSAMSDEVEALAALDAVAATG